METRSNRKNNQKHSVQFSCSVRSDYLWPHEVQHARLPCPSPTPRAFQTRVHWVGDAIQPSHPLLSPSPAFDLSQHQDIFQWVSSKTLEILKKKKKSTNLKLELKIKLKGLSKCQPQECIFYSSRLYWD